MRTHAHNYDLDPALLAAVIYSESRFRPHVRSARGAIGLMQLLPSTAEGIATRTGGTKFVPSDLDDPELNVRYGAWYLRHLRQHYAGRPDAMTLALAAYNAGMANVDSWVANTPSGPPAAHPRGVRRDARLPGRRRARAQRLPAPLRAASWASPK